MKIRFIPAGTALLSGAITCLICIQKNFNVIYSLQTLLIVLVIFTLIGFRAQQIIMNVMHEQKKQEEDKIRQAEFDEAERIRKIEEERAAMEQENVVEEE